MLARLGLLAATTFMGLAISTAAPALPKVTIENINGFEVHFLDIGAGDSFAVTYYLPVGTLHDRAENLGRAHLLEHVIHIGSKAFPGHHALNNELAKMGADSNAHTAYDHTFYHASARQQFARRLLEVFLAPLAGLEGDKPTFKRELSAVVNEIAGEVMNKDLRALEQMTLTHLLPRSHPWARPILGSRTSLRAMTFEQVEEAFRSNYRPEFVRLAIHGNFSDPKFLADAKKWTAQYLNPQAPTNLPVNPQALQETPALTATTKRLYAFSDSLRAGQIFMQGRAQGGTSEAVALDMLMKYLNLKLPGTLIHELKSKRGWVSALEFYAPRVNDKIQLEILAMYTEEGLEKRDEIEALVMELLRSVQVHGIPAEVLELLKTDERRLWELNLTSARTAQNAYMEVLASAPTLEARLEATEKVTSADVREIAKIFSPERALFGTLGPKLTEGARFDRSFKRGYAILDGQAQLNRDLTIFQSRPIVPRFEPDRLSIQLAEPKDSPRQALFTYSKPNRSSAERFTVDLRRDLQDNAVRAGMKFAPQRDSDIQVLELVRRAFELRYSGEAEWLRLKHFVVLHTGNRELLERDKHALWVSTGALSRLSAPFAIWILEKLRDFVPTQKELEIARSMMKDEISYGYSSTFSAGLALDELGALIDPFRPRLMEDFDRVSAMDLSTIPAAWTRLKRGSNKEFVFVGDLRLEDALAVREATWHVSPWYLDRSQNGFLKERGRWADQSQDLRLEWPKAQTRFGLNRTFLGPKVEDLRESAAFLTLGFALQPLVYNHNRGDQKLGYIHSATVQSLDERRLHLTFYGQAENAKEVQLTMEGWDYVLLGIGDGTLDDEMLQEGITSAINFYSQKNVTAPEFARTYVMQQGLRGDPRARAKIVKELETMSVDEVKSIMDKYLFSKKSDTLQVVIGDCTKALL